MNTVIVLNADGYVTRLARLRESGGGGGRIRRTQGLHRGRHKERPVDLTRRCTAEALAAGQFWLRSEQSRGD